MFRVRRSTFLTAALFTLLVEAAPPAFPSSGNGLWYTAPGDVDAWSSEWLPIGNGYIAGEWLKGFGVVLGLELSHPSSYAPWRHHSGNYAREHRIPVVWWSYARSGMSVLLLVIIYESRKARSRSDFCFCDSRVADLTSHSGRAIWALWIN